MAGADYSTLLLLTIALTNLLTALLVVLAKANINKIERATNSMKDELVASTAQASRAEGRAEGRAEQRDETKAETEKRKVPGDV